MKISFLGGAREVTGSMHLVEAAGKRILLDCGLFEGHRREAAERNRSLSIEPSRVDCCVLSHAHIDHSGNLPTLCARGFRGPVYATHATRDLCGILLQDSAHIQADDADYLNRKRRGLPPVEPLYGREDVEQALGQFVGVGYDHPVPISPDITLTFRDAGHILGAAIVVLAVAGDGGRFTLGYTGDIGRDRMPMLRRRAPAGGCDALIMESTYGNRLHAPIEDTQRKLEEAVNSTRARGGKIIVPAFSVGNTQQVIHALSHLIRAGRVAPLPVFVDSPLSVSATDIFRMHPECYNDETHRLLMSSPDPLGFDLCRYVRATADSKKLNTAKAPCVIISASGMCEGGRIRHHLKNNVEDPRNTILIVGFCAAHTLGRRIVEREPRIPIFGETYRLRAQVVIINAFSAHADRDELLGYVRESGGGIRRYFLTHGEEDQALPLADAVRGMTGREANVPRCGESVAL